MVGGGASRGKYLADHVKPQPGERVLDIGCGPADILGLLPDVEYTGLDISSEYIEAARLRYGSQGRFICVDVGAASLEEEDGAYDLVMATGVVHHLDDERAHKLFTLARRMLKPGGRLITFDGCYLDEQSRITRWFLDHDRGKFIRTKPEYVALASSSFASVEAELRDDLLRIPYTHLIMRCTKASSGEGAAHPPARKTSTPAKMM